MSVTALHPLPISTGPYLAVLHIRNVFLAIFLAAPPPSSTCPHVGSLHCHQRPLPPRHLVFHFPNTSDLPQALPLSHLATTAPSCFSLSNPVRSFSGTPSFEVHEQVVPTVPLGYGGVTLTYLTLRLGYNTAYLILGSGCRSLTPSVGYRRPKPTAIFNTLRAHLTLGKSNASLTLG
jgi:hypothetical protein